MISPAIVSSALDITKVSDDLLRWFRTKLIMISSKERGISMSRSRYSDTTQSLVWRKSLARMIGVLWWMNSSRMRVNIWLTGEIGHAPS